MPQPPVVIPTPIPTPIFNNSTPTGQRPPGDTQNDVDILKS